MHIAIAMPESKRGAAPSAAAFPSSADLAPAAAVRWDAVQRRDASHDGTWVYAVTTTGVFCRPSCPSRRPRPEHVRFFDTTDAAARAGFRPCLRCRPLHPSTRQVQTALMIDLCRYIETHLDEPLTLARLGRRAGMSTFHLQRTFKATVGLTPREYVDQCRLKVLKGELQTGHSVTHALYEAGYGSASRLYERTDGQLGMKPTVYRRGGAGEQIRYRVLSHALGHLLVAATPRGVCAIQFGDSEAALVDTLRREFPSASLEADSGSLADWTTGLAAYLDGRATRLDLPLDIQATAFQREVWSYLQTIPYGETRSYADVASALGRPGSARAVARACATNPVALAVPCHRVVASGGGLQGYRWGVDRKRALLARERGGVEATSAARADEGGPDESRSRRA